MKCFTIRFVFFLCIPLFVALGFHLLWQISIRGTGIGIVIVAFATFAINSFITPIYLIMTSHYFFVKNGFSLGLCIIISIVSLYGSIYLQFWNWGTATGSLTSPDSSSLMIIQIEVVFATIIFAVGTLILTYVRSKKA